MSKNLTKLLVIIILILGTLVALYVFKKPSQSEHDNLTQLPSNYSQCKKSKSASVNALVCDLILDNESPLLNDCANAGGGVSHADFSGKETCAISYYNLSFDRWPQNYGDCVKVFGDLGGSGACGEIIPRGTVFKEELSQVLELRDRCLAAGGKVSETDPLVRPRDQKLCIIAFRK